MYLSTTMGSILNGLGKTSTIFLHNAISMLITLAVVVFCIPMYGIHAYLAGLLFSELVLAALHIHTLALCLLVAIGILYAAAPSLETLRPALPAEFLFIVVKALILCVLYGGGLLLLHRKN